MRTPVSAAQLEQLKVEGLLLNERRCVLGDVLRAQRPGKLSPEDRRREQPAAGWQGNMLGVRTM